MHPSPFGRPGRFWRGNLHGHSTLSDGRLTADEVCRRYREAGYDFISLTEHFLPEYSFPIVDTVPYRGDGFTTIIGAELHAGETEIGGKWHILAVGLPQDFTPPRPDESGPEIAARARATGAFVAAAHPQWYSLTEADIVSLGEIDAIEVYNGVAIDHNDRSDSWHITDVLLGKGHRYLTYAADDFHFVAGHNDFACGWVWVKSEELTPAALLAALKAGSFYASTGPMIHDIQIRPGQEVVVCCSPAQGVFVTGRGPSSVSVLGHGLTEVVLDMRKFSSPYCRITVRDEHGDRAWSNPIWFDTLAE